MDGLIEWASVDGDRFERASQMLLSRLHDGVRALDGSGGDGGKDSTLVTGDGLTVFEMKSHSSRLTSGQKRNIKSSLRAAVANAPGMTRWELVLPLNPTPRREGVRGSEEAWFEGLSDVAPGVQLVWRGRDWLDQQFAAHPDLVEAVEGPQSTVMRLAGQHNLERAVLASGVEDVAAFTASLKKRSDDLSLYWKVNWAVEGDVFTSTLQAKDPDAAELDPIRLTPEFSFSRADPDALAKHEEIRYAVDFGDSVEVPGEFITRFDIEASPDTRRLLGPGGVPEQLSIQAVKQHLDPPVKGTVKIRTAGVADDEGTDSAGGPGSGADPVVARLDVHFTSRTSGQRGARLFGRGPAGILGLTVDLPRPADDGSILHPYEGKGLTFQTADSLAGYDATDLVETLNVLRHVRPGYKLEIRAAGFRAECGEFDQVAFENTPRWWQLASDLARLAQLNDTSYVFPDELDLDEVDMVRLAVRLLDGSVSIDDPVWPISVRTEALREFLSQLPTEVPGGFFHSIEDTVLHFGEQRIPIGTLTRWAPGPLRIRNRADLEARVAAGLPTGEGIDVQLESLGEKARWLSREEAGRIGDEQVAGQTPPEGLADTAPRS